MVTLQGEGGGGAFTPSSLPGFVIPVGSVEFLDIQHLFSLFRDNIIQVKHNDSVNHEQDKKCKKWMKNMAK